MEPAGEIWYHGRYLLLTNLSAATTIMLRKHLPHRMSKMMEMCNIPDRFPRLEKQKMPLQLGHGRGKKLKSGFRKMEKTLKSAKKNAGDFQNLSASFLTIDHAVNAECYALIISINLNLLF